MNTRLWWVRIHNREERLFRASKCICPKMRPHLIRRRQHLPNYFPLSRKFARLVSDIFVSQAMVHNAKFSDSKTWHESKLDIIFVDKNTNSTKLPTRFIRPISPHIKVFSSIFFYPFLSSCRATDVATGRACHDPKELPGKGKLCIRVPPPDQRIGRPHAFLNLTSLELSAAAFGGIKDYKNCHLFDIIGILEL